MSLTLLCLLLLVGGVCCIVYAVAATQTFRVACLAGGCWSIVAAILLLTHAVGGG